jgi:hypothetical protein
VSDTDDAERTSGKTAGAEHDATKHRKQHTQHPHHGNPPAHNHEGNAITGCIVAKNNATIWTLHLNE